MEKDLDILIQKGIKEISGKAGKTGKTGKTGKAGKTGKTSKANLIVKTGKSGLNVETGIINSTAINGKAVTEEVLKQYGDTPLSQVEGVKFVVPVSSTWEKRSKSNIVKWLIDQSGRSLDEVAECLGCTTSYVNNKLYRDSFSLDDMIIIAYVCGYALTFTSNNSSGKERNTYQINIKDYFETTDPDVLKRLYEFEERLKARKKEEYDELKAKLEKMKEEYGFED